MLFITKDDFYGKAAAYQRLPRAIEKEYAMQMMQGNAAAREKIIASYLPTVAAYAKRLPPEMQTLELIYRLVRAMERAADSFDFLQENDPFSHRLSFVMRAEIARYIADRP